MLRDSITYNDSELMRRRPRDENHKPVQRKLVPLWTPYGLTSNK